MTGLEQQWSCQTFRSITSDSVDFLKTPPSYILNKKKGRSIESSIAQAYVQMIRNARNFIYIENQYFLGSAYSWLQNSDVNCHHTIPAEITQKLVEKIISNQRFVAYIVIPMFPNGNPANSSIQQMLFYQYRTMEMMYKRVAEAIKESGSNTHPTDWLLFLCLGKREEKGPHLDKLEEPTEPMAKQFRQTLRFPIYVHSKMMIVDDAYIILGSANINERSMSGSRDTEMCVGCWQPSFTHQNPNGEVHRFRMSLWTEHFRSSYSFMKHPWNVECVRKVKELSDHNWKMYIGPSGSVTPGHMLRYPLLVMDDGSIQNLPDHSSFPDFPEGSKVIGGMSTFIPQKLTT
jgi:phospholipase D1/2